MADLGDTGEAVGYLVGFWEFLFSRRYRTEVGHRWRGADRLDRALMALHGAVATLVGVGLPLAAAWLIKEWVAD